MASLDAGEDRVNVKLPEVPEVVQQAVLATEDRNFFRHGGVDPVGTLRAFLNDIRKARQPQRLTRQVQARGQQFPLRARVGPWLMDPLMGQLSFQQELARGRFALHNLITIMKMHLAYTIAVGIILAANQLLIAQDYTTASAIKA